MEKYIYEKPRMTIVENDEDAILTSGGGVYRLYL